MLYTPLDLAKRKNHELVVDYLRLRQGAKLAEELPEEMRNMSQLHMEQQIVEGELCAMSIHIKFI